MKVYAVIYTHYDKWGEVVERYVKKVFDCIEDANKYMFDTVAANSKNVYTLSNSSKGTKKMLRIVYADSKVMEGEVVELVMSEKRG